MSCCCCCCCVRVCVCGCYMESVIHYSPALSTPGDACGDCNVDDGRADDAHDDDYGDYDGLASDAVTLPAAGMHPWLTRSR